MRETSATFATLLLFVTLTALSPDVSNARASDFQVSSLLDVPRQLRSRCAHESSPEAQKRCLQLTEKMSLDAPTLHRKFKYLDEPENEPLRRFLQVVVVGCLKQLAPKSGDSFSVQKKKLGNYFPCIEEGYLVSVRENGGEDVIRRGF